MFFTVGSVDFSEVKVDDVVLVIDRQFFTIEMGT